MMNRVIADDRWRGKRVSRGDLRCDGAASGNANGNDDTR